MSKKKKSISINQAVQAIEKHGILLVYPIQNRKKPDSLWSAFYPDDEMVWEWDEDSDDRVAQLWHLKTELGTTRRVIYAKWYQGRATYFSKEVFVNLLALAGTPHLEKSTLSNEARQILEVLEMDSPLSTKQIKLATELRGKFFARAYERAMKELWAKLFIAGFGEVDDGAFPSLAVGATKTLFEELWEEAKSVSEEDARAFLLKRFGKDSLFLSRGPLSLKIKA